MDSTEFRKQVKDALEHLYDTAHLGAHPLLNELVPQAEGTRVTRAHKLRGMLKETIEALRPQQDLPSTAPEWRSYNAVRYRYTQGMTMAQVENALGISQRQLQRDFHKGLDGVIALLEELRATDSEPRAEAVMVVSNQVTELRQEMQHWQMVREPCEVATLFESVRKMLPSGQGHVPPEIRVELPPTLEPVLVDSTLTRQALFQLVRLLLGDENNEIVLRAQAVENQIELSLGARARLNANASDWQMAQVLIEHQGGTLTQSPDAGIVIVLPQAYPPRVLVIDDNRALHELFERYLTPNFYQVIHAYHGADALPTAIEAQPDIVLLDVMMPAVDGWQVLQALHQHESTRAIPIVICSVLQEPALAFSMGARAYLKKPVDRLELLATMERLLKPARAEAVPPPAP